MDLDVTETGAIFTGVRERVGWGEGWGGVSMVKTNQGIVELKYCRIHTAYFVE